MAPHLRKARPGPSAVIAAAAIAALALAIGPGLTVSPGAARAAAPHAPVPTAGTTPTTPATSAAPEASEAPSAAPSPTIPAVRPTAAVPPVPLPATPSQTLTPSPSGRGFPPFGAFLDSGSRGVARMADLSHWLGGTELKVAHTYLPGERWSDIEGPPGFLDAWADWRRRQADRTLVLNVPMQERNEEDVPDSEVRLLLGQAAAGAFDHHFRALAERLVELKVPDTVIVLGWEMNGTTYTHRCAPDPQAWKTYWKRIVTTMRSVPGQSFRFDFTPSRGLDAVPWTECYPGDDVVDIIGMDSYDQPSGMSFDEQVKEPFGLQQHVDFARSHGKPISYPEWGLFRNGDNTEYMRRMLAWIDEHEPLYNTLTDYCPHGVWQCSANPLSARIYRAALYARTEQPAATPSPTPTPEPVPAQMSPADCPQPDLEDWFDYWLGGKLCIPFDWWSEN
ncbi:glycoside hydrolase family 26 protein [Streptomyces sp. NRRL S-1022]|uniref:glycoside hydrolase family 26 protein n=1 Tax=Streptomyces sp. NRRL S-1022 TaxID=1463880 RepID=UPI0004C2A705|nr:glycosyl hydrolase [Streptomyces sp. NRRL S-1022]